MERLPASFELGERVIFRSLLWEVAKQLFGWYQKSSSWEGRLRSYWRDGGKSQRFKKKLFAQ